MVIDDAPSRRSDTSNLWELTQRGRDYLERSGVKSKSSRWLDDLEPLLLAVPQALRETKLCAGREEAEMEEAAVGEDATLCMICGKDDSDADNPILLCDGCDGGCHLGCIELQEGPEGEWFCRACQPASGDDRVCEPTARDGVDNMADGAASAPTAGDGTDGMTDEVTDEAMCAAMEVVEVEQMMEEEEEDAQPTIVGLRRRRVVGEDDDEAPAAHRRRLWDSERQAVVTVGAPRRAAMTDAALAQRLDSLPFRLRFAMLTVRSDLEKQLTLDVLDELKRLSSLDPPDWHACERMLRQADSRVRIPRPPMGKTVMLEAELKLDGSWQYSSCVHGSTIAHAELGSENILKVVVPDLRQDAVGQEQERLAQREKLLSHTLFGRRFRFFGQKSDHSCRDVKAFLVVEEGKGPNGAEWSSIEEGQEQLAHFSQVF